jgi:hypothetical protein
VSLKASLGELILAWDGAQTGTTIVSGGSLIPSLDDQVQQVSSPVAGALYTLDIGGNDIFNAVFAFNMACLPKVRTSLTSRAEDALRFNREPAALVRAANAL